MASIKALLRRIVVGIITWEARMVLRKYKPYIIAVTGSVGKTSTKDAIYTAIRDARYARKSQKSFNSDVGVPLTILNCDSGWSNPIRWSQNIFEGLALIVLTNHYPKWLVLEIGADHPGDIEKLTKWIKPHITVITELPNVPVHVEYFADPEDVVREKTFLAHALTQDGTLILGGDSKKTAQLKNEFPQHETLRYGIEPHNDISASHIDFTHGEDGRVTGMKFRVDEKGSSVPTQITGRIGHQQVYPVLAAFAVARAMGVEPLKVAKALEQNSGSRGRMRVLDGRNESTIIDDSYNSSPVALRAAFTTLKRIETKGKKIAIIGDMLELGRFSAEEHKKAGVQAAGIVNTLVTVGVRAKGVAQAARDAGFDPACIQEFDTDDAHEAGCMVRAMLEQNDIVLVKGSQSIRLEKAVKEMLAEPLRARELLVRQDETWLAM